MKDAELNEFLRQATVPERGADYWGKFPGRVTAELEWRRNMPDAERSGEARICAVTDVNQAWSWERTLRSFCTKPAVAVGIGVCLALVFVLGLWKGHSSADTDPRLATVQKYFHEVEGLFPNQLQAIVFDRQGTHLVLAADANLPVSPPLYLKICGPKGCQAFVTFSGQQIRVNGDVFDVLTDGQGNVLLVGREVVWSSAQAVAKAGRYTIEARPLQATS